MCSCFPGGPARFSSYYADSLLTAFCAAISLDAVDISGSHGDDDSISVAHNGELHKIRINADGSRKGLGEYIAPKQQWGPFTLRRPQEVMQILYQRCALFMST